MRFIRQRLGVLRLALGSAALVGFALALLLAASPKLHTQFHDRAEHHECLAIVLQNGAYDSGTPAPTLAAFVATLFEVALPDNSRTVESLFLSCQVLEHAPPVIS